MPQVLIVGSGTLLDEGLIELLEAETDFQISRIKYRTEAEVFQIVVKLQPEVIVISETSDLPTASLVTAINHHTTLPGCRIIIVQPDSNTLRVCELVTASHSEDLLRLIRSGVIDRASSVNSPPNN